MYLNIRCCLCVVLTASVWMVVTLVIWLSLDKSQELEPLLRNDTYEPFLLVFIHSRGDHEGLLRRAAIRNTWLSDIRLISQDIEKMVEYKFVLGGLSISDEAIANATREQEENGDLIIFDDVTDSHDSLTLRTLRGLQYITENKLNISYMFKCDDDTFVTLRTIASELAQREKEGRLYWGEFLGACGVMNDGPYAENDWKICETYLPYAFGGGYTLSRDLIELISKNGEFLNLYHNEDVSVGSWLAPYNLQYRFDARFTTGGVTRGCKRQFIVIHKIKASQMYDYYYALKKDGYPCNRKNRWFGWHGYIYRWTTLPSKCCRYRRRVP